jgi:hypothetical protein
MALCAATQDVTDQCSMDSDFSPLFELGSHQSPGPDRTTPALSTDSETATEADETNNYNSGAKDRESGKHRTIDALSHTKDAQEEVMGITDLFEEAALQTLADERDAWKLKAEESAMLIEKLEKRQHAKMRSDPSLAKDAASRINALERENQRLKSENKHLKERLKEAEGENVLLSHETHDKSNKLRGANKKAQKEKNTANKEKEKTKSAVNDKNERLKAERNWRMERNDALAALQDQKKVNGQLIAELEAERSGHPHMREDGTNNDYTTVVIPIEFKIYRGDYLKLQMIFDANRIKLTHQFQSWYTHWMKTNSEHIKVVGADYVSDKTVRKIKVGEHLYDDVIESTEAANGGVYIPQTGAERDGWRSKRGLSDFCRNVQADYNNNY